jgi:hypothetical protein
MIGDKGIDFKMTKESNYVENMFYVPIAHVQVDDWENKKKKLIELYKQVEIENKDNVWTNYYKDSHILNQSVSEILKDEIVEFHKFFGFIKSQISSSWFEKSLKNNSHRAHNHGSLGYSAVCFVEYDKTCHIPTNFVAPFLNFLDGMVLNYMPKIDEGSLIFFPSSIVHNTFANQSEKERIILSFNLDILQIVTKSDGDI